MMSHVRESSTPRGLAALAVAVSSLFALGVLIGSNPAAAQGLPDVTVYHSPDPEGADPRAEYAPGCMSGVETLTVDFEAAPVANFQTTPYTEDGATITVNSGHYDIFESESGNYLNLDEIELGLSQITVTLDSGLPFDVVSFDVLDPADTAGEYTISALGGGGGSIGAPTAPGLFDFGPEFEGIDALVITQNAPGFFGFDDLILRTGPLCVLQGTPYDTFDLWIDGGPSIGAGTICKMDEPNGNGGGTGDQLCGADLIFQLEGVGKFVEFIPPPAEIDPGVDTLVIGAECLDVESAGCALPVENEKQLRMNFRRGSADPPVGPRRLGMLVVDSTGLLPCPNPNPTRISVFGNAAGAKLQLRPIAAPNAPELIADSCVTTVPEPGQMLQLVSGLFGLACLQRLRRRS